MGSRARVFPHPQTVRPTRAPGPGLGAAGGGGQTATDSTSPTRTLPTLRQAARRRGGAGRGGECPRLQGLGSVSGRGHGGERPPSPPLPRRGNEAHERDPSGPHVTRATAREDPCSGGHSTGVRGAAVSGIPESQACARRRLWAQPQMPRARLALHIHTPYVHTHVHTHRHTIRARTHVIRAHAHAHTHHTHTSYARAHTHAHVMRTHPAHTFTSTAADTRLHVECLHVPL